MIEEDYVSFETAKLLKEKGFPQDPHVCNTAYTSKGNLSNNAKSFVHNSETYAKCGVKPLHYSMAPTLQMAMKWLREEKHLQICVSSYSDKWEEYIHGWQFLVKKLTFTEGLGWNWDDSFGAIINKNMSDDITYKTYEEACEAGIKHCLEILI